MAVGVGAGELGGDLGAVERCGIDAQGNVTITTPKEVITGDWAKYDPQTEKLKVGGNVKLVQGTTVLLGNELVSDLKTDRTQMKGGRVKGSFLPK